jgi:hypothetical protein
MSDRAYFRAGFAASGYDPVNGTYGTHGMFGGLYPNPTPSNFFDVPDYDMSNDDNSSSFEDSSDVEDSSDDEISVSTTQNKRKMKKANARSMKVSKFSLTALEPSSGAIERMIRMVHRYLNKDIGEVPYQLSEESKQNLARIARDARFEYRSCAKERLKHLEWAAKTLTTTALTPYVRLFRVDKQVETLLGKLEREADSVKENSRKASLLESFKTMSEAKKFKELVKLTGEMSGESKEARDSFNNWALTQLDGVWCPRFRAVIENQPFPAQQKKPMDLLSRPLAEVPFNKRERRLVEGILVLLMRVCESVACRPWPQIPSCSNHDLSKEDQVKVDQIQKIRLQMKREEDLLDMLRGLIEIGWPRRIDTQIDRCATTDLIDDIRTVDAKVNGLPLLPSTACMQRIVDIANETYLMKSRSPTDLYCAMPSELMLDFEQKLHLKAVYDKWRATEPFEFGPGAFSWFANNNDRGWSLSDLDTMT